MRCDGPEDCYGGQVCCGNLVQNRQGYWFYSELSCKSSCSGNTNRVVCGKNAGVCPSGTTCKGSTILPGYNLCG